MLLLAEVLVVLVLSTVGVALALGYVLYRRDMTARRQTVAPWSEYSPVRAEGEPRRVALFYWGSRGDFQPLAVLAQHLKADGHAVQINVRARYFEAARGLGLEPGEIFEQEDDHAEDLVVPLLQGKSGPAPLYHLFRHIADNTPAYVRQLERMVASIDADAIVINELAFSTGQIVAERLGLPLFVFRYTPLFIATGTYAFPLFGHHRLGRWLNWASFVPASLIRLATEWRVLRALRPGAWPLRYYFGRWYWQFPSIQSYSSQLMPIPSDTPPWYVHAGPLLPPAQEQHEPVPPKLAEFLEGDLERDPVIYVGFGSFSLAQFLPEPAARRAAHAILDAIEQLGIRAVLLEHTFEFMRDDPRLRAPRLYVGTRFPHSWLFPRVSVIVHQAGAGHCAASARSGTPTITIPIFEEQEFNARMLIRTGAAIRLGVADLTPESFVRAFHEARRLSDDARILGEAVRLEVEHSGTIAVAAFRRLLGLRPRERTTR